jgi:hypothetical protein
VSFWFSQRPYRGLPGLRSLASFGKARMVTSRFQSNRADATIMPEPFRTTQERFCGTEWTRALKNASRRLGWGSDCWGTRRVTYCLVLAEDLRVLSGLLRLPEIHRRARFRAAFLYRWCFPRTRASYPACGAPRLPLSRAAVRGIAPEENGVSRLQSYLQTRRLSHERPKECKRDFAEPNLGPTPNALLKLRAGRRVAGACA